MFYWTSENDAGGFGGKRIHPLGTIHVFPNVMATHPKVVEIYFPLDKGGGYHWMLM